MACLLEPLISKVTELVWDKAIVRIGAQFKYVCCYKSCIEDLRKAEHELENQKIIIEEHVGTDSLNLIDGTNKANEWLEAVGIAQEEVKSLIRTYEEGQAKMRSLKGQILNPVARHKFGRNATKNILTVKELDGKKPTLEELAAARLPPGIVVDNGVRPLEKNGIVRSTSMWIQTMEKVMTAVKDDSINVVGLYGMGGVGKSTLISDVLLQVREHCLFNEVAQVEVKAVPDITRIQDEIASILGLTLKKKEPTATRAEMLAERLLKIVDKQKEKKSVLIILDDLWEKLDLSKVGIPLGNDKVKIKLLLTSRDRTLLSDKMGAPEPIQFGVLSDDDAVRMFKSVVGDRADVANKASEIAKKCSGLPVIIMAIANALKDMHLDEWDNVLKRLEVRDELSKLEVSYEYLPSEESKHLFLLCGIVRGPRILIRDLLKYTFGLGLYERKDIHTLETAETELKKFLSGLEAASMLLKSDDIRYVNIHDRMRDLAVKIVDRDHREFAHFTLRDYRCKLPRRFDAPKLELLLSYCEGDSLQVQDSFFRDMKKLYVLEFTNLHGALSLPSPTHLDLGNLETLCLHDCCLNDISMIGELKGLQILSFRGSNICKLPIQLRGLTALKMLDLSDCKKLTLIEPDVLGSLTKLEELNMENSFKDWEIEGGGDVPSTNARLSELKNMTRLSNVRIHIPRTFMLPKDGQLFSSKLTMYQIMIGVARYISDEHRKYSRVLMLTFDSPNILWQDWVQSSLHTTEVLYLSGRLDGKCESISEMCTKGFECLKHLQMSDCPSFRFIVSSADGSSTNLESLFLENLEKLEKLCGGLPRHEEAFNKLRVVKVEGCSKLTHLFDLSLLKSRLSSQLEEITIKSCAEIQCIVVDEVDINNYEVVTLSSLQKLEFDCLPKFSSFCTGPSSNVLFTGKKVAFPRLESLVISGVDELEHIWDPTDPPAELGNLLLLKVERCNKLVRVINSVVLMRLQQDLEYLIIRGCGLMKEVFDVEGDGIISSSCTDDDDVHDLVLFSRLKELWLRNNNNLMMMMVMKGSSWSMTIFPNIELLNVSDCSRLRYVLCCSLSSTTRRGGGGYENIKEISIEKCGEMEAIVEVMLKVVGQETQQADSASSISDQLVHFRRLKRLRMSSMKSLKGIYNLSGRDDRVVTMFQDIETLQVLYCHGLRYVLPARVGGLVHLREITITTCNQIEAIVLSRAVDQETQPAAASATGVSYSFSSLRKMKVYGCHQLRTLCHYISSKQETAVANLPFFSQKEIFPCLESLRLEYLSKLGEIWPGEVPPQSSFKMLKQVTIWRCPEISMVFPSTLIARLENLTDIKVEDCKEMKQIIRVEEKKSKLRHVVHGGGSKSTVEEEATMISLEKEYQLHGESETRDEEAGTAMTMEMMFTFPCLTTLVLMHLPKVDTFYSSSSACSFQFPSLETVEIQGCGRLITLFSQVRLELCLDLAIPNLKSIKLWGSENLKSLMGEKPEGRFPKLAELAFTYCSSSRLLPLGVDSPSFCNVLTELTVECCDKLEYLLSPHVATSLVHLTYWAIRDCQNIKEVVVAGEEEEAAAASNENQGGTIRGSKDHIRDITFSRLKVLKLDDLPRLEKFSSVDNIVLNFPSLEHLDIWKCPNITTFSSGIATATSTEEFGDGLNSFVKKNINTILHSLRYDPDDYL